MKLEKVVKQSTDTLAGILEIINEKLDKLALDKNEIKDNELSIILNSTVRQEHFFLFVFKFLNIGYRSLSEHEFLTHFSKVNFLVLTDIVLISKMKEVIFSYISLQNITLTSSDNSFITFLVYFFVYIEASANFSLSQHCQKFCVEFAKQEGITK